MEKLSKELERKLNEEAEALYDFFRMDFQGYRKMALKEDPSVGEVTILGEWVGMRLAKLAVAMKKLENEIDDMKGRN